METNKIYCGDAETVMKTWPAGKIDCCVTSPPYWGLRDYGEDGQGGLEPTMEEHPAGKIRKLPDGGLILHLSASQPQWIISWVMAHAGEVELLAPEALRKQIVATCNKALEKYRSESQAPPVNATS